MAHLMKHQNCEGLKTEMAKTGLEHRLHAAQLGRFCFQHYCYVCASVPDGDHNFWTDCCNWFLRIAFLLAMTIYKDGEN